MKHDLFLPLLLTLLPLTLKSQISVLEPYTLVAFYGNREIPFVMSNFGDVPYGRTLTGEVVQASPSEGCVKTRANYENKIVLVSRGNCHFAEKVHNAQQAGALMVIIVDNVAESLTKVFPVERGMDLYRKVIVFKFSHFHLRFSR